MDYKSSITSLIRSPSPPGGDSAPPAPAHPPTATLNNLPPQAVLVKSEPLPGQAGADVDSPLAGQKEVKGHDFSRSRNLDDILGAMLTTGYQATSFGRAAVELERMTQWRLSDDPPPEPGAPGSPADGKTGGWDPEGPFSDPATRERTGAVLFLAFTSNLISSGVRETLVYLAKHRMFDVLVTTAGGVEEDLIKCLAPTYTGDFHLRGADLRKRGLNRIGNLLVPNDNYCSFEDWLRPIVESMCAEQEASNPADPADRVNWTPSKIIDRLGAEMSRHPRGDESVYAWCHRNDIPVFCPALTDGSIGDMLYFHTYKAGPGRHLRCDIVEDVRRMNDLAVRASPRRTGVVVLGGGVPKHHCFNANLMRNGADFCVIVTTATDHDGSDSGAAPDEAKSWGKLRAECRAQKVVGDATILWPLLVSQTFAKTWWDRPRATARPATAGPTGG